jgi:hypothetical protein
MQQSECTYKNNFISSVKINSVIENMAINRPETSVLTKLLLSTDLTKWGHDLSQTKTYSIAYWARKTGYCYSVVKRTIEQLHARGMILIYGKTWNEYLRENGTRVKTRYMLEISISPTFANFLVSLAGKVQAVWQFDYVLQFKMKLENFKRKAQECRNKYLSKAVNILSNSCEQVGIQQLPNSCEQVGIQEPHLLNQRFLNNNTKPINSRAPTAPNGLMNGLSKMMSSISASVNTKKNEWNESVTRFCLLLMMDGMTYNEVGLQMIQQAYCGSIAEFKKYFSPPNIS